MPKEIFQSNEYEKYRKYLTGNLKLIKAIETCHSHTTIAYMILPTTDNENHKCDKCGSKASFLLYDRDHMGQTSVNLWCEEHVEPIFKEWVVHSA
jgi:hypothetical protein